MNIVNAIRSGRPFLRPGWDFSLSVRDGSLMWGHGDPAELDFRVEWLLVDDWETQEPTVTITRTQFWEAVHKNSHVPVGCNIQLDYDGIVKVGRELGLETSK